jgi:hypothetical protein
MHQEQEVYHSLYKDKLEKLIKEAIAERLPELQNGSNGSEDDDESDSDGEDSSKSSTKQIRALRMKIRREVRAEAWANESEEVRCQVKEEIIREREGVAETNDEESKVGLERSPESREL